MQRITLTLNLSGRRSMILVQSGTLLEYLEDHHIEATATATGTEGTISLTFETEDSLQAVEMFMTAIKSLETLQPSVDPVLGLALEHLDLTERPRNCLARAQVRTIGDLTQMTEADLQAINNFGRLSINEVKAKLAGLGLSLTTTS